MKANATVSVRRNAVQNKKARTTGKVCTKKNTGSPFPQASADLPEQQIALDSIVPNDFNPRRNFSEQSLRELADNMTRVGLIHAVTLRPLQRRAGRLLARMRRKAFSRGPTGGVGDHTG